MDKYQILRHPFIHPHDDSNKVRARKDKETGKYIFSLSSSLSFVIIHISGYYLGKINI